MCAYAALCNSGALWPVTGSDRPRLCENARVRPRFALIFVLMLAPNKVAIPRAKGLEDFNKLLS